MNVQKDGFIRPVLKCCGADNCIRYSVVIPPLSTLGFLRRKISMKMSDVALKKFADVIKKQGLGGKIRNINNHIRI